MANLPPRSNRPRVAVPVDPPVLSPSLIPFDVMQAYEREAAQLARAAEEAEIVLSAEVISLDDESDAQEHPSEVGFLSEVPADPEVALMALNQVKQFHGLPAASLRALAEGAKEIEVSDGEMLFLEGDQASSFYVVLEGTLEILRRKEEREVALRHIGRGEPLGLFGLFSGQVRAACARAIGDALVLEVQSSSLEKVLTRDSELNERLLHFYQERLLEGFLGSSRLFAEVDSIARARMIGRFKERNLAAGEVFLHPGEVTNLLLVVTHGTLMLEDRPRVGQEAKQFEVTQGQYLAVTGAVTGLPTRLKVHAPEPVTVVMLGQKEMNELMRDYPALRNLSKLLPSFARALDRDVYCGHTGVPGL